MTAAQKGNEKIVLDVEKRDVFGKKLKGLREEGKIPGNIFGKAFTSTAIFVDSKVFLKTYRQAGETQIIYLKLGKDELPVLVAGIQQDPITDNVVHIDFKKMDLTQKTEAQVPVVIVGESPAVAQKVGDLINPVDSLTVEALPDKIPSEIEVDVSGLTEIDDAVKVSDLKGTKDYTLQDDPETVIAKIAEHKEEEIEVPVAEDAEDEEGVEGEAATEGGDEAPADGGDEKPVEDGDKAAEKAE